MRWRRGRARRFHTLKHVEKKRSGGQGACVSTTFAGAIVLTVMAQGDPTAWTPPPEPTRALLGNGKSRGEPVLRHLRYRLILVLRDGILVHHLFWTRISTVFPSQHLSPCACPNPL
jgi:hypothetical protein